MQFPLFAALLFMGPICLFAVLQVVNVDTKPFHLPWLVPALFAGVVLSIAVQFFFFVLPSFRPYAWVDEWIYFQPLQFTSLSEWITWAFAQHADHRIPIQKITNFFILKAAGFDFRYMVGVNYLMAIGLTGMLLYVAKAYRGCLVAGDLIIPLLLLHYANGLTQWGFHFTFLSSVFFFGLFVFFGVRYAESERVRFLSAAVIALIAESLTGISGLVPASIATVVTLGWLIYNREPHHRAPIALLIVALLIEGALWLNWTPSSQSDVSHFDLRQFALYTRGLIVSSTVIFSYEHATWKFLVFIALFIAALAICLRRLLKGTIDFQDTVLALGATTAFLVVVSVAIGRSKAQGEWSPGIGMHYGFLSVLIPLMSWIMVSKCLPESPRAILGLTLAVIFFVSFKENSDWRFAQMTQSVPRQEEIVGALKSGDDAQSLGDKYAIDFSMSKDASFAIAGIKAFRAAGFSLYGGHN